MLFEGLRSDLFGSCDGDGSFAVDDVEASSGEPAQGGVGDDGGGHVAVEGDLDAGAEVGWLQPGCEDRVDDVAGCGAGRVELDGFGRLDVRRSFPDVDEDRA